MDAFKEWDVGESKLGQMKKDPKEKDKNKEKQAKKVKEYEKDKCELI
jgi:hypothetical protein